MLFLSNGNLANQYTYIGNSNLGSLGLNVDFGATNTTLQLSGSLVTTGTLIVRAYPSISGIFNTANNILALGGLEVGHSWANGAMTVNMGSASVDIGANGLYVPNNGGPHNLNLDSSSINCAGQWTLTDGTGTITQDAGTSSVAFDGTTAITNSSATSFNNLSITGTLTGPASGTVNIGGNWTNNGTFNHNSGTVNLDNTGQISEISGSAMAPNFVTEFNNLTVSAGKTVKFENGKYFKVSGQLALNGTSGSHVTLDSTDGANQWYVNYQPGSTNISYADVSNSGCDAENSPSTESLNLDDTNSNVTNNGYCWFAPYLSFSMDSNAITFDNLSNANNWTSTKTTTCTTSTNAKEGYVIQGYITDFLTSLAYPSETVDDFSGTWALPTLWDNTCVSGGASYCGFGYTSNDTSVQGSNRFLNGTKFAGYGHAASGDILADHTDTIASEVVDEQFTITHKVSAPLSQSASTYQTSLVVVVTATY